MFRLQQIWIEVFNIQWWFCWWTYFHLRNLYMFTCRVKILLIFENYKYILCLLKGIKFHIWSFESMWKTWIDFLLASSPGYKAILKIIDSSQSWFSRGVKMSVWNRHFDLLVSDAKTNFIERCRRVNRQTENSGIYDIFQNCIENPIQFGFILPEDLLGAIIIAFTDHGLHTY